MQEYFQRSKSVPISLYLRNRRMHTTDTFQELKTAVSAHVRRLRTLEIDAMYTHNLLDWISPLTEDAPRLSRLRLAIDRSTNWVELPSKFLNGGAPVLRHLTLMNCTFPWSTPFLLHLTSFNLCIEHNHPHQLSMEPFLDTLEQMHSLVELGLGVDFDDTSSTLDGRVVALTSLQILRITNSTTEWARVLRYVAIPPSALLRMQAFGNNYTDNIPPSEHPPIPPITPLRCLPSTIDMTSSEASTHAVKAVFKTLQLSITNSSRSVRRSLMVWVALWEGTVAFSDDEEDNNTSFPFGQTSRVDHSQVHIEAGNLHKEAESFPRWILSSVSLSDIRVLDIGVWPDSPSRILSLIVADMPLLETIYLGIKYNTAAAQFLQYFKDAHCSTAPESKDLPLPKLLHLRFFESMFGDVACATRYRLASFGFLLEALRIRADAGGHLPQVAFNRCCNITQDKVDQLKTIGVEVVWDGIDWPVPQDLNQVSCVSSDCPCSVSHSHAPGDSGVSISQSSQVGILGSVI
ncbi:hypothetical protein CC2G_010059 [Coprinopsis cinerea AmutBmut pab1-1]|nr:hypothetical protein CC2G_010059 [Coprinopsis cinerea AmutBmut pab1-1]